MDSRESSATSVPGSDDSSIQSKQLSIFTREVRNLLRSKPNCMIPFSKFVPAYHNHYGRQCCVYSYGFTKLIELLEAIPHVVQIVGEGTNRYITLTKREQIKRFASDLIKVVKAQPGKRLQMAQMPRAYEALLGRTFRVQDYGTNNLQDLLNEIWEGTINIIRGDRFEIPKRERSEKEIRRTRYFVWDVIKLLSTMPPDYSVPFSKFIPSYHHYYNRQCKVAVYGFSKLIDLFESISPDTVEIVDLGPCEEKLIKLAPRHYPKPPLQEIINQQHHKQQNQKVAVNNNNNNYHDRFHHHHSHKNNSCSLYNYKRFCINSDNNNNGNSPGCKYKHHSGANSGLSNGHTVNGGTTAPAIVAATNNSNGQHSNNNNNSINNINSNSKSNLNNKVGSRNQLKIANKPVKTEEDSVIDRGPTEEELLELEQEWEAYHYKLKRSNRMAVRLV